MPTSLFYKSYNTLSKKITFVYSQMGTDEKKQIITDIFNDICANLRKLKLLFS
jgi:hypothetical protein